jgi:putative Holliday junction resolvase
VGVDVGSVRVGVAVSDPDGILATPVCTLSRDPVGQHDLAELADLVHEAGSMEVVVGLPRTLSGDEGRAAQEARQYAQEVAARVSPVPVRLYDERLTTVDAHRSLRDSGVAGRRQRSKVDQAAAVLILQAALDVERASGQLPGELVRLDRRKPRTKDRGR